MDIPAAAYLEGASLTAEFTQCANRKLPETPFPQKVPTRKNVIISPSEPPSHLTPLPALPDILQTLETLPPTTTHKPWTPTGSFLP